MVEVENELADVDCSHQLVTGAGDDGHRRISALSTVARSEVTLWRLIIVAFPRDFLRLLDWFLSGHYSDCMLSVSVCSQAVIRMEVN